VQLIKKNKSLCPKCTAKLDSRIIEENNKIYMIKKCKKHGKFKILISKDTDYYKETSDFYFAFDVRRNKELLPKKEEQEYYNLFLTMNCNLNCPICHVNVPNKNYKEPTLDWIKKQLKNFKNVKIGLFGGEPTTRKGLVDIIEAVKESGNIPALHTNGIKICNYNYLKKLKEAGLVEIHLQFDGFDEKTYQIMRGRKLLNIKKKALENIKRLNIPTILQVAISRNLNENQIKLIFDYAVKNNFVKGILYKSYSHQGRAGLSLKNQITVDEQIGIIEKETKGRISKQGCMKFQKLFYIFLNMVKTPRCFYNHYYLVLRRGKEYRTINEMINFDKVNNNLNRYKHLYKKNKLLANLYLFLSIHKFINYRTIPLFYSSLVLLFNKKMLNKHFVFGKSGLTNKNKFLIVEFGTICDMHNFDFESCKNCDGGEITTTEGINPSLAYGNVLRAKCK